jgi:YVTN family beta-propeller protein
VALALVDGERKLLVANRDSGTISCLDTEKRTVLAEYPTGAPIAALAVLRDGELVCTAHTELNCIRLWNRTDAGLTQCAEVAVPQAPVALRSSRDGKSFYVASLWGRAISRIDLQGLAGKVATFSPPKSMTLPFFPRQMLPLDDGKHLLVADAFAGQLAVIDVEESRVARTLRIPGHNIRGLELTPDGKQLVVAHQILNQLAETSHDGVFWGIVMTNNLRILPIQNLLDADHDPLDDAYVHFLGDPRAGAGDPAALAVTKNGTMLVALGGVDEVAVGMHLDHSFERIPVGRRPVAIVTDSAGEAAYVANQFSDSVSVFDVKTRKQVAEIALRRDSRPPTPLERGEALYYDARLSLDSWYSCHSCHTDGHSIGQLNDNLGDGNYGAPKRIPSLFGVGQTGPWLWSGRQPRLDDQIRKSIMTTMHGPEPDSAQLADLALFVSRVAPPPRPLDIESPQVARGAKRFEALGCVNCHPGPTYTSAKAYDVGVRDQHGRHEFNPPSLRGLRLRGPYFHDNRAKTLRDVVRTEKHQLDRDLNDDELADLIAFLESL